MLLYNKAWNMKEIPKELEACSVIWILKKDESFWKISVYIS